MTTDQRATDSRWSAAVTATNGAASSSALHQAELLQIDTLILRALLWA